MAMRVLGCASRAFVEGSMLALAMRQRLIQMRTPVMSPTPASANTPGAANPSRWPIAKEASGALYARIPEWLRTDEQRGKRLRAELPAISKPLADLSGAEENVTELVPPYVPIGPSFPEALTMLDGRRTTAFDSTPMSRAAKNYVSRLMTGAATRTLGSALRIVVTGLILLSASEGHAAFYCVRINELPQVLDTGMKQRIESYLEGRYQIRDFKIGQLQEDVFIAWPGQDGCKPCYHHIIQLHGRDLIELLIFEGGGAILFSDANSAYDKTLHDTYTYRFLKQANKSYLSLGLPKSPGAPFVEALPAEAAARLPSCEVPKT